MSVTDMVELGFRSHEVVEVEFVEFESNNWTVNVRYQSDSKACRLVSFHEKQSRTWSSLNRAVASMKSKLQKGRAGFNNFKVTVLYEKDP